MQSNEPGGGPDFATGESVQKVPSADIVSVRMFRSQVSPVESFFIAGCLGLGMTVILRMAFMLCLAVGKSVRRPELLQGVRASEKKRRSVDGERPKIPYEH